jgi:trimeric autotransporter adhesin
MKEKTPMKLRAACVVVGFLSLAQLTFAQSTAETASALPRLVRFGGTVKDLNGNPLTGVVGITFALYSEQTGGAALWLETQNVTADGNGRYVALLGSTKTAGLPTELFTSEQARWVGVQVSGQAEQPRVLLVSAPYALKAGDAETVGGLPPSAFRLAVPQVGRGMAPGPKNATGAVSSPNAISVSGSGTTNYVPLWTSSSNLGISDLFQLNGQVGVGTTTPGGKLDVLTHDSIATRSTSVRAAGTGLYGISSATTGGGVGVIGEAHSATGTAGVFNNVGGGKVLSGQAKGKEVFSINGTGVVTVNGNLTSTSNAQSLAGLNATGFAGTTSTDGIDAVGGANQASTGTGSNGVLGTGGSGGNGGNGLVGIGTMGLGFSGGMAVSGAGVVGTGGGSDNAVSGGDGVDGFGGGGDGPGHGVSGVGGSGPFAGGSGVSGLGGSAIVGGIGGEGVSAVGGPGSGGGVPDGDGIFATAGGPNGLAGYFLGDLSVTGAITAGTKDFKIDHPLDPANKYLFHASVESSEMMDIYSGNVRLDDNGNAVVQLPNWFQAVNGDFRYQLTAIGAPGAGLYVAQEISGNEFKIAGGKPGGKVSWQVTAVRQDAYAKAHPLQVEQLKGAYDRGYYIHPELYGAPAEKGIEWARYSSLMRRAKEHQMMHLVPKAAPSASRRSTGASMRSTVSATQVQKEATK